MPLRSTVAGLFRPFFADSQVPLDSIEVPCSIPPICSHPFDELCPRDDELNLDMISVPIASHTNVSSTVSSSLLSAFWQRYDRYDWTNLDSSGDKVTAAINEFIDAGSKVINFPAGADIHELFVPLFVSKSGDCVVDPRAIAQAVIDQFGLKVPSSNPSTSASLLSAAASLSTGQLRMQSMKAGADAKPASNRKEKGKGIKMKNFTKEEDFLLSKAFVRVSLDPIRGNDQKSHDFWSHVFLTFVTLYKNEAEVQEEDMGGRNVESIKSQFQRNIQKDVIEYSGCYHTNELRSGENQEDYLCRMDRVFEEKKGKPFRFRHCLSILRQMPKFDWETRYNTNVVEVVDDFIASDDILENPVITPGPKVADSGQKSESGRKATSSFSNNASTLKRPQGTKAAKRKVVDEYLADKAEDKKMKIFEQVAGGLREIAQAVQQKQHQEHLHSMLLIHQTLGNREQVLEYLKLLESTLSSTDIGKKSESTLSPARQTSSPPCSNRGKESDDNSLLPNVATTIDSPMRENEDVDDGEATVFSPDNFSMTPILQVESQRDSVTQLLHNAPFSTQTQKEVREWMTEK